MQTRRKNFLKRQKAAKFPVNFPVSPLRCVTTIMRGLALRILLALPVGNDQHHIFVDWSRVDRLPSKLFREHASLSNGMLGPSHWAARVRRIAGLSGFLTLSQS
jgi:hypothetical protein